MRFTQIDLKNDQVWEFSCSGGEPPAMAIQTTYGLKCQGIKIFPRFTLKGTTLTDPRTFAKPPRIEKRLSNYLLAACTPFPSIDVKIEYWVPTSTTLSGRTHLINNGFEAVALSLDWAVVLKPKNVGEAMSSRQIGINTVLSGKTSPLFPVFFLTGGPVPSTRAYPALSLEMTLPAGAERRVSWTLATLNSQEASFTLARQGTAQSWEAELLKHEMEEKRKTFIFTSEDTSLDAMLHESQVKASQCLLQGPPPERRTLLLSRRKPDEPLGSFNISVQTRQSNLPANAYELWMASRILLPGQADTFKELIRVYLDHQQETGAIPWKINPNGTPSSALMPPMLAGIALDAAELGNDGGWISQMYPPLLDAFKYWFHSEVPENGAHWPVWDHLLQTGMDSAPLYSTWNEEDQGLDLKAIDNPALGAMLYHECQALMQIGRNLGIEDDQVWLAEKAEQIKTHVQNCWDEERATYRYQDIATGERSKGELLFEAEADGDHRLDLKCAASRRLLVRCVKKEGFPASTEVIVHGKRENRTVVEEFHFTSGHFRDGIARLTSDSLFTSIQKVTVTGLRGGEQIKIAAAGFDDEDLSLLLPLWAGIPSQEQAERLVKDTLQKRYLTSIGLVNLPTDRYPADKQFAQSFWNSILVEGLLAYGFRELAAQVFYSFIKAVELQRQRNFLFTDAIRASDGQGIGERDTINSLPALMPLLRCLGVEQIKTKEILLDGLNIYLPSFTVQYGRTEMLLTHDVTTISTINGSKVELHEAGKQTIVLP